MLRKDLLFRFKYSALWLVIVLKEVDKKTAKQGSVWECPLPFLVPPKTTRVLALVMHMC